MPELRPVIAAGLAVIVLATGCASGSAERTSPEQPDATASQGATGQGGVNAPVYEGPDEFSVRQQFMPLLNAQQHAAEAALGEVAWLGEPAFQYRQSMSGRVVASLQVVGTTRAGQDQADSWVRAANEELTARGFSPVDGSTRDAGGGLLLVSPNVAADACFSARWGQGSLALTVEVGAVDGPCG